MRRRREALKLSTVKLAARERERRDARVATDDDNSSIMIHVDVHRAYFYAQAKPNTCVEVPDEDQPQGGEVCRCLICTERNKQHQQEKVVMCVSGVCVWCLYCVCVLCVLCVCRFFVWGLFDIVWCVNDTGWTSM